MSVFIQKLYDFKEYIVLSGTILFSIVLIYQNENPQMRSIRLHSIGFISIIAEQISWISSIKDIYWENHYLRERNLQLSIENNRYKDAMLENIRLRKLLAFKSETDIPFVVGEIVGRNTEQIVSTIVLNIGGDLMVKKNMPIITDEGFVGRIIEVGQNYSLGQLLFDRNFHLSVKIQRTRITGIAMWSYSNICDIRGITKQQDVKIGDVVITSGYGLFPENIKVGVISEVSNDQPGMFKKVKIRTSVDFQKLEEVFVLLTTLPAYLMN